MEDKLAGNTVLQLTVNNHPGVMSHIMGLFTRRAYNVEGIVCMPMANNKTSRVLLLVNEDEKLEQVMRQTLKLVDIIDVHRYSAEQSVFTSLAKAIL